jgi:hypothetical protein
MKRITRYISARTDRVVESLNLGKRIPDLSAKLTDDEGQAFK